MPRMLQVVVGLVLLLVGSCLVLSQPDAVPEGLDWSNAVPIHDHERIELGRAYYHAPTNDTHPVPMLIPLNDTAVESLIRVRDARRTKPASRRLLSVPAPLIHFSFDQNFDDLLGTVSPAAEYTIPWINSKDSIQPSSVSPPMDVITNAYYVFGGGSLQLGWNSTPTQLNERGRPSEALVFTGPPMFANIFSMDDFTFGFWSRGNLGMWGLGAQTMNILVEAEEPRSNYAFIGPSYMRICLLRTNVVNSLPYLMLLIPSSVVRYRRFSPELYVTTSGQPPPAGPPINTGNWFHIAVSWTQSTKMVTVYLNGVVISDAEILADNDQGSAVSTFSFNCLNPLPNATNGIDEFWRFPETLNPLQIQQLMSSNQVTLCAAGSFFDGSVCQRCAVGSVSIGESACAPCSAGTLAMLVNETSGVVSSALASGGNVCATCPLGLTSYAGSADCTAACTPTNFAVGLQYAARHRVEVNMSSTTPLLAYDAQSGTSDFTTSLWFYPTVLNVTQYLATKDGSWYIQLTSSNQIGVRLVPYMPVYLVSTLPTKNISITPFVWHHLAVSVGHRFWYASTSNFSSMGASQAVNSSSTPTIHDAVQSGYNYLLDQFSITIYIDGRQIAQNVFQWAGSSASSLFSTASNGLASPISFTAPIPVVSGQPINLGACMALITQPSTYFRDTWPATDMSSFHLPCAVIPYYQGSWNGATTRTPSLFLDDAAVLAASTMYTEQLVQNLAAQYVVSFEREVESYSTASVLAASGANVYLNAQAAVASQYQALWPFLNPNSSESINFQQAGFFNGQMDDFMLFNSTLLPDQIWLLAHQPIISPSLQLLDPGLMTAMTSLIALLQFEEWLSLTTGTVGSALLVSLAGYPGEVNTTTYAPLHVNNGPLCYPASGAGAGQQPTYATMNQQSTFSPSPSTSYVQSCSAGSSSWSGGIYCFACPIGYSSSAGGACALCPANTYNTAPGSPSCPLSAPAGVNIPSPSVIKAELQLTNATVYGVYLIDLLPGGSKVAAATTAVPGSSAPPTMALPSVPLFAPFYVPPSPAQNLSAVVTQFADTGVSFAAIANLTWALGYLSGVEAPVLTAQLVNGSYYTPDVAAAATRRLLSVADPVCRNAYILTSGVFGLTSFSLGIAEKLHPDQIPAWVSDVTLGLGGFSSFVGISCGVYRRVAARSAALAEQAQAQEQTAAAARADLDAALRNSQDVRRQAEAADDERRRQEMYDETEEEYYDRYDCQDYGRRRRLLQTDCSDLSNSGQAGQGGEGGDGFGGGSSLGPAGGGAAGGAVGGAAGGLEALGSGLASGLLGGLEGIEGPGELRNSTHTPAPPLTASLCLIFYSLPGNPEFPWSSAVKLSVSYLPTPVSTSSGTAVQIVGGVGTRTFTNKFGFTTNVSVTLLDPSSTDDISNNLLYLGWTLPFDASGIVLSLSTGVQLPGQGPSVLYSTLRYSALDVSLLSTFAGASNTTTTYVTEGLSARIDPWGSAFLSSVSGFENVTLGGGNINIGAVGYSTCEAPITFANGACNPTNPSSGNGGLIVKYTYFISDGVTWQITTNLSLTMDSALATHVDVLGNQYQNVVGVTGTRTYTYLPTGAQVISTVSSPLAGPSVLADQRFYPFAMLSSPANVYSLNTAPFVDYDGIEFSISPAAPAAGLAPGVGTQYSQTSVYTEARLLSPVLVDGYFSPSSDFSISGPTGVPVLAYQEQQYVVIG